MATLGSVQSVAAASVGDLLLPLHTGGTHGGIVPSPLWLGLVVGVAAVMAYLWHEEHLVGFQLLGVGLLLAFGGTFLDSYWHLQHGGGEVGVVPPAHFVSMIGGIFAVVGAVQAYELADGKTAILAAVAALAGTMQLIGGVWDNALHYQGIEPAANAPPHVLNGFGMLALLATAIVIGVVVNYPRARAALS